MLSYERKEKNRKEDEILMLFENFRKKLNDFEYIYQ